MTNVTLDTFHLDEKDELQCPNDTKGRQHTHGSFLSHLSLDALHREQERVSLRTPDSEPEEALVPAVPSFVLLLTIVGDNLSGDWVGASDWKVQPISHLAFDKGKVILCKLPNDCNERRPELHSGICICCNHIRYSLLYCASSPSSLHHGAAPKLSRCFLL